MLPWTKRVDLKLWIIYLITGVMFLLGIIFYIKTERVLRTMESTLDMLELTVPIKGQNEDYTVSSADIKMIWIEPGTFMMGSPEDELDRRNNQHEVTLTRGYWLGKYEITQAQYKSVMGTNPSKFKGADLPVECVSWNDATNFCAKLTAIEREAGCLPKGYEYTLPTEAQWEYACRAGTTTVLNSGKNLSDRYECPEVDEVGWYDGNSDGKTHPVGQKKPNAWGLYDMHGNVWEWCLDWYGAYPTSAVVDPTGAEKGERRVLRIPSFRRVWRSDRVLRGGSWDYYAYSCRSAYRDYGTPGDGDDNRGFRVALSAVR